MAAFVLYPAWVNEVDLKPTQNPYYSGIEQVGIGAFPFLPGRNNSWLVNYFIQHLGLKPTAKPNEVVYPIANPDKFSLEEPARIAYTGLKTYKHLDLTLVANLRKIKYKTPAYLNGFLNGTAKYYHIPVTTLNNKDIAYQVVLETRYFVIAVPENLNSATAITAHFIYKVKNIKQVRRCDLTVEQAGSLDQKTEYYWLFELASSSAMPHVLNCTATQGFAVFMSTAQEVLAGKSWQELVADRVYKTSFSQQPL